MASEQPDMSGICYLCGASCDPERFREHVPPKSWFPGATQGLITVCCCKACNNANSRADEYFRLVTALVPAPTPSSVPVWDKAVKNTVRGGRLKKEVAQLRASMAIRRINGQLQHTARLPGRPLRLQAIRMTKGFLRHFYPSVDYSKFEWDVTIIDQSKIAEALNNVLAIKGYVFHERGNGAHRCVFGIATDEPDQGLWIHLFHEWHCFVVSHRNRRLGHRKHSQVHFHEAGKANPR